MSKKKGIAVKMFPKSSERTWVHRWTGRSEVERWQHYLQEHRGWKHRSYYVKRSKSLSSYEREPGVSNHRDLPGNRGLGSWKGGS